jgi:hypothetical protein
MKIVETAVIPCIAEEAMTFPTGAKYIPVSRGTADNKIVNSAAGDKDFLGYARKPTTKDDIAIGDVVDVVIMGVIGDIAIASAVTQGDLLVPAGTGKVKKTTNLTIAAGGTAVTSTLANGDIIEGDVQDEAAGLCGKAYKSGSADGDLITVKF